MTKHPDPKKKSTAQDIVFLPNLDKLIKIEDVDEALSKFGEIFTSRIVNGKSTRYGYVQFETRTDAERCLAQSGSVFVNNLQLEITPYFGKIPEQKKVNLLVKKLPKTPPGKIVQEYLNELKKELKVNVKWMGEV